MNSKAFFTVSVLVAVLLIMTSVIAGAQDVSVAVVDSQEIVSVHPAFREVQQELREKQNEMREELEGLGEEEAEERKQEMQVELSKLQQELQRKAFEEVNEDIGNMAEELGYDVVISRGGIISGRAKLAAKDITEDIITEMEEKYDLG